MLEKPGDLRRGLASHRPVEERGNEGVLLERV